MMYSRDTPFWSETLDISSNIAYHTSLSNGTLHSLTQYLAELILLLLYGNLEELRRTAAFVRATGISI